MFVYGTNDIMVPFRSEIMKATRKLNVAIVGCGYFGIKRLQALTALKDHVHLVGLVDSNSERLQSLANAYGISGYKTIEELPKTDLTIISTPNNTHATLAEEAILYGSNVLCEKPLAISSLDAQRIILAAKKGKRFVKTGSNHRFFPTVIKAQELVKQGTIGKILSFRATIGNDGSHTAKSWFWDPKVSGGGTFIDNGCHVLDLVRMFMGDFVRCMGYTDNLYWNHAPVEDSGLGVFVNKSNAQAVIYSSWLQWAGYLYIEMWGERGYIIIDSRGGDRVMLGFRDKKEIITYDFSMYPKISYELELQYFIDCIRQDKSPQPNAEDGKKVIEMIEGVYASSKQKKWVVLPEYDPR